AVGFTLLALGCLSTAAATLRLRRSSLTLVTFGLWCAMYGARLLAREPAVRAALGGSLHQWQTFGASITYAINVPITIFTASLIGAGWRRSIGWLVGAIAAFAVIGIASDLVSGRPLSLNVANSWVVLTAITIGLVNVVYLRGIRTPLTDPIVMIGGLVLVVFIFNENL